MSRARFSPRRAAQRAFDLTFGWMSLRPLSIAVFAGSVALLFWLQSGVHGQLRARAVASANSVEHPALVTSFVASVYVRPGDHVEEGTPLAELSPYFVERELERVTSQIEQLLHESRLAQARLLVEEERWLTSDLRSRPARPSLEKPTEKMYTAQLHVLRTEREQLLEAREQLTIKSRSAGRVALVMAPGSPVALGASVAAVTPDWAEEIVAYLAPEEDPAEVLTGARVTIVSPALGCSGEARVLRRGAGVEQAPGQLGGFLQMPLHGTPVFISVPEGCRFGVGQVLTIDLPRGRIG